MRIHTEDLKKQAGNLEDVFLLKINKAGAAADTVLLPFGPVIGAAAVWKFDSCKFVFGSKPPNADIIAAAKGVTAALAQADHWLSVLHRATKVSAWMSEEGKTRLEEHVKGFPEVQENIRRAATAMGIATLVQAVLKCEGACDTASREDAKKGLDEAVYQ